MSELNLLKKYLSEDEIEALEILKAVGIKCKGICVDEVIINLIDKQSKEIEELKEKNRQSKMRIVQLENEITARIEDVNQYYTPNDKIKAKIDYLLKHYDSENFINFEMFIKILQSLLEKE